jgi:hypothetical protein
LRVSPETIPSRRVLHGSNAALIGPGQVGTDDRRLDARGQVGVLWRDPQYGTVLGACGFDHIIDFFEAGEIIELAYDITLDRWLQHNRTRSKVVPLRLPWEQLSNTPMRFDDVDEFMRGKRANRTPIPGTGIAVAWHREEARPPRLPPHVAARLGAASGSLAPARVRRSYSAVFSSADLNVQFLQVGLYDHTT